MRDRIEYAKLDWGDGTSPRSFSFDDIYFAEDGPAETRHVFLGGNDLPARFANAQRFTIGEIGFGTGLNFLVAWDAWAHAPKPARARLNFLSVEKFPLAPSDMAKAHGAWPALEEKAARLRAVLPPAFPGAFQCAVDDNVTLTLIYGDALDAFDQAEAAVDAWFLDGFAPAKNPDLWSPELIAAIARLSAPRATFATFTVAGAVRRALEGAGFDLDKRAGFGRKRDMLAGRLTSPPHHSSRKPWFDTRTPVPFDPSTRVAIIGAGIAGASLAHALRSAGYSPTIIEAEEPAHGASGNPAGLVMPRLDVDDTPAARFHAAAYIHTIRLLNELNSDFFHPCGVQRLATTDKEKSRQARLLSGGALPDDWMTADKDAVTYPQAGVIDPSAFVTALIGETPVLNARVITIERNERGWRLKTTGGAHECDAVIIANAHDARWFVQLRGLPLTGSAGQIEWFETGQAPKTALAFGPYVAPCPTGGVVMGATYAPVAVGVIPRFTKEATEATLAAIANVRPEIVGALSPDESKPRVSIRCTTPDRLPIAGAVPDWGYYSGAYDGLRTGKQQAYPPAEAMAGLYTLTGLGSRGLVTAPLCAAMIAAEIAGAPAPVEADVAEALHPARFFIRDLKRGK